VANPILNDKSFRDAAARDGERWTPPPVDTGWQPPIDDGPVTPWRTGAADRMTVGGTMQAAVELVRQRGGTVAAAACIIELAFLEGRRKLDVPLAAMISYDS